MSGIGYKECSFCMTEDKPEFLFEACDEGVTSCRVCGAVNGKNGATLDEEGNRVFEQD